MAAPILTYRDLRQSLGDTLLFNGFDLVIRPKDRICLIGRNGSGKSTLLRILARQLEPDAGEGFVQPGTRIAYMAQAPDMNGFTCIAEYVRGGLGLGDADKGYRAELLLDQLQIDPGLDPATLSGGEARRAALARSLVGEPDILLLDEPTNHFDIPAIEWLEQELGRLAAAIVLVSHDRAFLRRTMEKTWWLDRGALRLNDRGYADFERWSGAIYAAEEAERRQLDKLIVAETRWSHEGITARRKRNQGRLARLGELRARRADFLTRTGNAALNLESGRLSGKMVLEADAVCKGYGGIDLVRQFSTRIQRGDRIGIVGANGCGKTTLVDMLMGKLAPDSGVVRRGANLSHVYLDQNRAPLDDAASPQDFLCPGGGDQVMVLGRPRHVTAYLKDFLFTPGQARSPIASLSGGERSRLLLARAMSQPGNFLILDEPTNDLDMETLDLLIELLAEFDGTLLVVSHDRDFLNAVVAATLVFEGDGRITEYAGGYDDYLRQRGDAPDAGRAAVPARKTKTRRSAPATARLSYKFQRELEHLPARMAALEAEIAAAETALSDNALFSRAPADYEHQAERLQTARDELAQAEDRWLELEDMREGAATAKTGDD